MINSRFIRFILLFVMPVLFFSSCKKNNHTEVIERGEFIEILTDLHVYEGIMTDRGWYDGMMPDSSKSYYNFVFKKYNISRSRFDYSLAYYSRNLEDLMKIYDQVTTELNNRIPKKLNSKSLYNIIDKTVAEAEMRVYPVKRFGEGGIELWMQKNLFNFPGDTLKPEISLEKEIKHKSLLVLKAEYMIMPNDKSTNLKMSLIIFYKDSTSDTIQKRLKIKNGKWENYHLTLKTDSIKLPINVKATALVADSITARTAIFIKNISLRQYAPLKDTTNLFPKKEPAKIGLSRSKKGLKLTE